MRSTPHLLAGCGLALALARPALALEPVRPTTPQPICGRACQLALGASASWLAAGASLVAARQAKIDAFSAEDYDSAQRLTKLNHLGVVGGAVLGGAAVGLGAWAVIEVRW